MPPPSPPLSSTPRDLKKPEAETEAAGNHLLRQLQSPDETEATVTNRIRRITAVLTPHMDDFSASLSAAEQEVILGCSEDDAATLFCYWLCERVEYFSSLWTSEWKKRTVAEALLREAEGEKEQAADRIFALEHRLKVEGESAESAERRERAMESEIAYLRSLKGRLWGRSTRDAGGEGN
ncbi:hypothetical protein RUND412_004094 [Rhizina undulata]